LSEPPVSQAAEGFGRGPPHKVLSGERRRHWREIMNEFSTRANSPRCFAARPRPSEFDRTNNFTSQCLPFGSTVKRHQSEGVDKIPKLCHSSLDECGIAIRRAEELEREVASWQRRLDRSLGENKRLKREIPWLAETTGGCAAQAEAQHGSVLPRQSQTESQNSGA
jgi:hypothetical protein